MHGDVGKLKVQPQSCKVIPRAAPSVEVLSPKCNAPEIPKPLKASMLQGFFFKATTDGFRKKQTFKSCNWGPNISNENTKKLFFLILMFFHACQRRNIRLMTLSGCNKMQSSNCSCCETPFQWNLAFFTLFYMFQFYLQAFLACQNLTCLAVFAISLLWPFHIFSMFVLLDSSKSSCSIHAMTEFDILWLPDTARLIFDENMYTSNHHFCCSKLQGSEKWNQFWHLGWSTIGLHQTPGLPQCFQCQADSSASRLVKRWRHQAPGIILKSQSGNSWIFQN